jgi:hypothetical protein
LQSGGEFRLGIYFLMGNITVDRAAWHGSTMDRGGTNKRARWCLAGARRSGVRAHRCSPVTVEEDKPDEAVLEGCSPEHEPTAKRWCDGGKEWWRLELIMRVKEGARDL